VNPTGRKAILDWGLLKSPSNRMKLRRATNSWDIANGPELAPLNPAAKAGS
jgi:hypothetical protein